MNELLHIWKEQRKEREQSMILIGTQYLLLKLWPSLIAGSAWEGAGSEDWKPSQGEVGYLGSNPHLRGEPSQTNQTKPTQTKLNQAKPYCQTWDPILISEVSQTKPNIVCQTKPNQSKFCFQTWDPTLISEVTQTKTCAPNQTKPNISYQPSSQRSAKLTKPNLVCQTKPN